VGLLFVVPLYFTDSYSLAHEDYGRPLVSILASGVCLSLILIVVMLRSDGIFARRTLYIASLTITTTCLIVWRLALGLFAKSHVARRVVILCNTQLGRILAREIEERRHLGYRLIGVVPTEQRSRAVGESSSPGQTNYLPSPFDAQLSGSRPLALVVDSSPGQTNYLPSPFDALLSGSRPLTLVVDASESRPLALEQLLKMRAMGIGVNDCESLYELVTGKLPVSELLYSWLAFAPGFVRKRWSVAAKRLIDIVVGCALVVLTLPIALIAAIAVKFESPGGIFYEQDRVGMGDLVVRIFKLRSMYVNAETKIGAVWAAQLDPRVTAVGRLIRLFRIDELPQLINVIKGEMSLVGPRPERPEIVAKLMLTIPLYSHRHSMRPGLTGWAQVCYPYGATVEDAREKLCYDLYYIKNWSLLLDLQIMLQTVKVVLYGRGAR
jgi:lipopolysaccharide/colanic/teichoic acid biosynthesis glycosyltransferase